MMLLRLKTHTVRCVFVRFENVLESASKRKRIHIVSVWTVKKRLKTHQNEDEDRKYRRRGCL